MNDLGPVCGDPLVCDLSIYIRNRKGTCHCNKGSRDRAECLGTASQERKIQVFKGTWCVFPDGLFLFVIKRFS